MAKPRKFQKAEELKAAIQDYFDSCDARNAPLTVTGLANSLGTSRRLLLDVEKSTTYSEEIKSLILLAKQRIGQQTEEGLLSGRYNAAGCIFTLKNNWGYVDKVEKTISVEHSIAETLENRRRKVIESNALLIEETQ